MRHHMIQFANLLATILLLVIVARSHADVTITLEHETVLPGGTAMVGVFASSDSSDIISGFNLPLDINDDGMAPLPTGFTLNVPPLLNLLYANTAYDTPPSIVPANVDAIPTGSGADVTLNSITKLFDLVVHVDNSVPVGTVVPLRILIPATPLESLFNVAGPNNPTVSSPSTGMPTLGSITVVPEPSSFFLILFAIASICISWLGTHRWRARL